MKIEQIGDRGYAICADGAHWQTVEAVEKLTGKLPLIVTDPPYGNVLSDMWDRWEDDAESFQAWMIEWTKKWAETLLPNAAFYVWGGIGIPGFRPFFHYLATIEQKTNLKIANLITWKKKRAYGVKHNYLFTREECVYLFNGPDIKKPRRFNIPLLEEKRGYAGYNAKYPAKSEFYRRTNVWADITEVMQGKVHEAQKAQRVIEIPIEVHTQPGEFIVDMFAGSGTAALAAMRLGRRFVVIEKDKQIFDSMLLRVKNAAGEVVSSHGQEAVDRQHKHATSTGIAGEAESDDSSLHKDEDLS